MKRYRHDPNAPGHLRSLVESARGDGLGEERRRLVAERLGIAPTAGPPPSGPVRKSSPASRAPAPFGAIALTAVAFIGGAVAFVAVNRQSHEEPPLAAAPAITPPPEPPSPLVDSPPSPAADATSIPSMRVGALRDAPAGRAPVAKPSAGAEPGAKGSAGDLRLEIAALDRVRHAAEARRPREALALLDDYAAKFPSGRLREEALVLRIEALHASGDQAGAERLAQQLLRSSPNTPYAARVRSVLAVVSPKRE
ncbi:MAG: hypothetical protein KF894_12655 [Labilithrix sp.]|nr:hypothetical protein [Labilithrix sp.]